MRVNKKNVNESLIIGSLLIVVAGFYSFVLMPNPPLVFADTDGYVEVAADLSDLNLEKLHLRPIGYPIILWLTGTTTMQGTRLLWYVHIVGYIISVWISAEVLRKLGVRFTLNLLFSVLAVLPYHVEIFKVIGSDGMALVFLTSGLMALFLWLMDRRIVWLVFASIMVPYSGLIRPAFQITVFTVIGSLIFLHYFFKFDSIRDTLLKIVSFLLVGELVIIGSVLALNQYKFGKATISPMMGYYLTTRTIGFVERLQPGEFPPVEEILTTVRKDLLMGGDEGLRKVGVTIWFARPLLEEATGLSTVDLESYLFDANILLIKRAPTEYASVVVKGIAQFMLPDPDWNFNQRIIQLIQYAIQSFEFSFFSLICLSLILFLLVSSQVSPKYRQSWLIFPKKEFRIIGLTLVAFGIIFPITLITAMVDQGIPRQRESMDLLILFTAILGLDICLFFRNQLREIASRIRT